ncbi:MAG: hypothetical protein ABI977_00305 [Acidobacteriota bacterium]
MRSTEMGGATDAFMLWWSAANNSTVAVTAATPESDSRCHSHLNRALDYSQHCRTYFLLPMPVL